MSQTSSGACMQRLLRFHNPCAYVFFSNGAGERQLHRLRGSLFVAYYLQLKRMRDRLLHSYALLVSCAQLREFLHQFRVFSATVSEYNKDKTSFYYNLTLQAGCATKDFFGSQREILTQHVRIHILGYNYFFRAPCKGDVLLALRLHL